MKKIPHFITFQKATRRLISLPNVRTMLNETVGAVGEKKKVRLGTIGSRGFEARHVSQYFLQRTEKNKPIDKLRWNRILGVYHLAPLKLN